MTTTRDRAVDMLAGGALYDANVHALLYVGDMIAELRDAFTASVTPPRVIVAPPLPKPLTYTQRAAAEPYAAHVADAEKALAVAEQNVVSAATRLEDVRTAAQEQAFQQEGAI
ncbi:hypothetical protein ACWEQ4_00970 [Rhodococcus sp. NPDC003994]